MKKFNAIINVLILVGIVLFFGLIGDLNRDAANEWIVRGFFFGAGCLTFGIGMVALLQLIELFSGKKSKPQPVQHKIQDSIIRKGDRVFVSFESSNRVESDGTKIRGVGKVDLLDDGFIYGKLEKSGRPFGCPLSDATKL